MPKKHRDCRAPKVANTKCKSRSDRSKPARLVAKRVSQFSPPTPSSRVPGKVRWNFGHGYQEKFGGILYHTKGVWIWKGEKFLSINLRTAPLNKIHCCACGLPQRLVCLQGSFLPGPSLETGSPYTQVFIFLKCHSAPNGVFRCLHRIRSGFGRR